MLKFSDLDKYEIMEFVLYPEYSGVKGFIDFLKSKEIKEINETNFGQLTTDFGGLNLEFVNRFWDSFVNELRMNGIKDNFNYREA